MFNEGKWCSDINVRDFTIRNYKPYDGSDSFLCVPTKRTAALWEKVISLLKRERKAGRSQAFSWYQLQKVKVIRKTKNYINRKGTHFLPMSKGRGLCAVRG